MTQTPMASGQDSNEFDALIEIGKQLSEAKESFLVASENLAIAQERMAAAVREYNDLIINRSLNSSPKPTPAGAVASTAEKDDKRAAPGARRNQFLEALDLHGTIDAAAASVALYGTDDRTNRKRLQEIVRPLIEAGEIQRTAKGRWARKKPTKRFAFKPEAKGASSAPREGA